MNDLDILFTSAGRRVELINLFRRDAEQLGARVRCHALDMRPELSAACRVADVSHTAPSCLDPGYASHVLELCVKFGVRLVVPLIDPELEALAGARDAFERAGIKLVISSPEVVGIARNKLETMRVLHAGGVPVPRTVSLAEFRGAMEGWTWPVILKPVGGSSSKGIVLARSPAEARDLALPDAQYLAQEYKQGGEYTVNFFCDGQGRLVCAVPHLRLETRTGEVSKGVTRRLPALMEAAERVAAALPGASGPLCFQAMLDADGVPWVFEINARFGGGFPLAHAAGAPFSRWILEEALGLPVTAGDVWREGVTMLRYDAAVFC